MTFDEFLLLEGPKYVVISKEAHQAQSVAFNLAPEPGCFTFNGIEYVAINIEPIALLELINYIQENAGIEFEFTQGSGLVSLLTHEQVIALVRTDEVSDE